MLNIAKMLKNNFDKTKKYLTEKNAKLEVTYKIFLKNEHEKLVAADIKRQEAKLNIEYLSAA